MYESAQQIRYIILVIDNVYKIVDIAKNYINIKTQRRQLLFDS